MSCAPWLGIGALLVIIAICLLWSSQRTLLIGAAALLLLLAAVCARNAYKGARPPKSPTIASNT
jgi:hypothetical protein